MNIRYQLGHDISLEQAQRLYRASTLAERRPIESAECMKRMLINANLIVTAWHDETPVGIARSFSDFSYITYLADLAVDREYQRRGIGMELIARTRAAAGPKTNLFLAAAPASVGYYPHIGFQKHDSAWWLYPNNALGGSDAAR